MNYKFWQKRKTTEPKKKKSKSREWADAIIFAVVAATIIRVFFIEAYTIPSGSMEKSLLVGDFLFVSKVNYGARIPMTPVAFPFSHHTLPLTATTKAYWDGVQWKYRRLPGLQDIKRNDVVVFNFPEGDTVMLENQNPSYYDNVRTFGWAKTNSDYTITSRPVDKRENYIKRCIAIAGDVVSMNSTVRFSFADGKSSCLTLVYPKDAAQSGAISILAPVGSALLGLRVGDSINWPLPGGDMSTITVDEVLYQPEREGAYHR